MQLVIGYKSNAKGSEGVTLYCGSDRGEALAILKKEESPYVRKEIFSHPSPTQRKFYDLPKPVAKKASKRSAK